MIHLTRDPIDTAALLAAVQDPHCGAVVLFLGTVRELTGAVRTEYLEYDAYAPMAEQKLREVAALAGERWPIRRAGIVHRLGKLAIGDTAVAVAVSTPHRAEAFAAAAFIMDKVKELVPIWKQENAPDGSSEWVHGITPS